MTDTDADTGHEEEAHPKGSLFLLALFLVMVAVMWAFAYAELIARG